MRFAYADPPYFGCARLYAKHHPEALVWNQKQTHIALVQQLRQKFDGFALSCLPRDLSWLLPECPDTALVAAWVKPFGSGYKPGQRIVRAWEPVIYSTPRRKETDKGPRVRDVLTANATQMRGLPGVKPDAFNRWVIDLLGATDDDELVDLFPGSQGMRRARQQGVLL